MTWKPPHQVNDAHSEISSDSHVETTVIPHYAFGAAMVCCGALDVGSSGVCCVLPNRACCKGRGRQRDGLSQREATN